MLWRPVARQAGGSRLMISVGFTVPVRRAAGRVFSIMGCTAVLAYLRGGCVSWSGEAVRTSGGGDDAIVIFFQRDLLATFRAPRRLTVSKIS